MRRPALWLAILLVLATDAIVLLGVCRNRSGTPSSVIELTERELPLNSPGEENTGVSLRLNWIGQWYFGPGGNDWFDRAKLAEVGFDTSVPPSNAAAEFHYRRVLPRDAFVALEYHGEAWQSWFDRQREIRNGNDSDQQASSRLVAVDVAADAARLRERHPDRKKYLIVRGVVRLQRTQKWDRQARKFTGPFDLQGSITEILPSDIHVPLPFAQVLAKRPKRYIVELAYGNHFEPWISSVRATGE